MLRLAKLGSVVINAHNDHLSLETEAHVDLSSRTQWPEDALAHHDGLRTAIEVEQCLEAGFAESNEGQIVIRYDLFPAIRRAGFMITSCWTEWSPLLLKIDRLNDIGRPAFQYRERYANYILWMAVYRIILTVWDSTRKKIWRGGVVLYRSRRQAARVLHRSVVLTAYASGSFTSGRSACVPPKRRRLSLLRWPLQRRHRHSQCRCQGSRYGIAVAGA